MRKSKSIKVSIGQRHYWIWADHDPYLGDTLPRLPAAPKTCQYIRDFDRLEKETTKAEELYRQLLAIHAHRVNPGALWLSAASAKA
jgi:hypothetical protein